MEKYSIESLINIIHRMFPMRKSKKQKDNFYQFVKKYANELDLICDRKTVRKGLRKWNNIVIGDYEQAEVILSAHYDTPSIMLFRNEKVIETRIKSLFNEIILAVILVFVCIAIACLLQSKEAFLWLTIFLFCALVAIPSPYNANDNNSGVIILLSLFEEIKANSKIAIVLFDGEESGLKGSKPMRKDIGERLLINLDCVGWGEYITLTKSNKTPANNKDEKFNSLIEMCKNEGVHIFEFKKKYPNNSDHANMKNAVTIQTLFYEKQKWILRYLHSYKDKDYNLEIMQKVQALLKKYLRSIL